MRAIIGRNHYGCHGLSLPRADTLIVLSFSRPHNPKINRQILSSYQRSADLGFRKLNSLGLSVCRSIHPQWSPLNSNLVYPADSFAFAGLFSLTANIFRVFFELCKVSKQGKILCWVHPVNVPVEKDMRSPFCLNNTYCVCPNRAKLCKSLWVEEFPDTWVLFLVFCKDTNTY